MSLRILEIFYSSIAGIVCRRQILTTKIDPRTVRVIIIIIAFASENINKLLPRKHNTVKVFSYDVSVIYVLIPCN